MSYYITTTDDMKCHGKLWICGNCKGSLLKGKMPYISIFNGLEVKPIPEEFDYERVRHLRAEAREKLEQIRPRTLSQAGRVSGITPSDLALILLHLNRPGRA